MSRIGKMPISIPAGVRVILGGAEIVVAGPRGTLERTFSPDMSISVQGDTVTVARPTDSRHHRALHGLTRALVANMIRGVSEGFSKALQIRGVGYRAEAQGRKIVLQLGHSHPVEIEAPEGIQLTTQSITPSAENGYLTALVTVEGADKETVGQTAAKIRSMRPVEPYKGKGIRYADEVVHRKQGKAGKAGERRGF